MGPSAESFHYSRVSSEWGVLRLLASLGDAGTRFVPSGAHLMVEPGPGSLDVFYAPARKSSLERRLLTHTRTHSSQLLWRAVFALPLEVIELPDAIFQVVALDGFVLPLPTPGLQLTLDQLAARARLPVRTPQAAPDHHRAGPPAGRRAGHGRRRHRGLHARRRAGRRRDRRLAEHDHAVQRSCPDEGHARPRQVTW